MTLRKIFNPITVFALTAAIGSTATLKLVDTTPSTQRYTASSEDAKAHYAFADAPALPRSPQTGSEALKVEQANLKSLADLGNAAMKGGADISGFVKEANFIARDIVSAYALSEQDVDQLRKEYLGIPAVGKFSGQGYSDSLDNLKDLKLGGNRLHDRRLYSDGSAYTNPIGISDLTQSSQGGSYFIGFFLTAIGVVAATGIRATCFEKDTPAATTEPHTSPSKILSPHGNAAQAGPFRIHGRPEEVRAVAEAHTKLDNLLGPYARTLFEDLPEKVAREAVKIIRKAAPAAEKVRAVEGPSPQFFFTRDLFPDSNHGDQPPEKEALYAPLSGQFTLHARAAVEFAKDIEDALGAKPARIEAADAGKILTLKG